MNLFLAINSQLTDNYQEWPRQTKERPVHEFFAGAFRNKKSNVNRACFPKEKHPNSQKWAKFMNFSFWPFLWFGLPGRLLNRQLTEIKRQLADDY